MSVKKTEHVAGLLLAAEHPQSIEVNFDSCADRATNLAQLPHVSPPRADEDPAVLAIG
jgi:hypothetical protein